MGVALAAVMFAARVPVYCFFTPPRLGPALATKSAYVHAAHDAAWMLVGLALIGALLSWFGGGGLKERPAVRAPSWRTTGRSAAHAQATPHRGRGRLQDAR